MASTTELQALLDQTGWIQSLARRLVTDPTAADDLAQDTWVDALSARPDDDRPLRGWLATVMRNNLGKLRRGDANRRAREERASRGEELPSTLDVVERASTHKDVVLAVLALGEPYRTTLLMRYFEDLPYREIAKRTGVTRAAVNSRVTRGLEKLRQRLEAEYGDRRALHVALAPLAFRPSGAAETILGPKAMSLMITSAAAVLVTVTVSTGVFEGRSREDAVLTPASSAALVEPEVPGAPTAPLARGTRAAVAGGPVAEPARPAAEAVAAAAPVQEQEREQREWKTKLLDTRVLPVTIEELAIDLSSGDVTLLTSRGTTLEIEATVRARLDEVEPHRLTLRFEDHVRFDEKGGKLKVEDNHKNERGWDVSLVVWVPGELPTQVNTGSGDILLRRHEGKLKVNTGSGDVHLDLPERTVDDIRINTGSGDVLVDVRDVAHEGALHTNTGSGDVVARVRLATSSGKASFNTGSGDVVLRVPYGVVGDFVVRANHGDASIAPDLDLLIEKQEEGHLLARSRSGLAGGTYKITTGSGDATLALDTSKDEG